MGAIVGQGGELHMVIVIKRAATGEEITVPLIGRVESVSGDEEALKLLEALPRQETE